MGKVFLETCNCPVIRYAEWTVQICVMLYVECFTQRRTIINFYLIVKKVFYKKA
jgi:hypothetical protein